MTRQGSNLAAALAAAIEATGAELAALVGGNALLRVAPRIAELREQGALTTGCGVPAARGVGWADDEEAAIVDRILDATRGARRIDIDRAEATGDAAAANAVRVARSRLKVLIPSSSGQRAREDRRCRYLSLIHI
ncbi:MAG: hypothetical protein N2038_15870 [Geminicoccaceae bacterium]|nr:hypothetical protein [Geminicoccaceae bacterium]